MADFDPEVKSDRDDRRRYNTSERVALFLAADGKCSRCGKELEPGWHADHINPWSGGGPTDVINGQALCARCNKRKAAKMNREWPESSYLRRWQKEAFRKFLVATEQDFLLVACPGSGKTRAALRMAFEAIATGRVSRLVVVVPTEHLKVQWADAAALVGINLDPWWSNGSMAVSQDYDGVVVTYAQVASNPQAVRSLCREQVMAIFDEIHHAGDEFSWGQALKTAFDKAVRRLALSGTPFREKGSIFCVRYNKDGVSQPDFPYSYGDALKDEICRPILFPSYEGKMKWYNHGRPFEATFRDALSETDASRRLKTALRPNGDWIKEVILSGNERLTTIRMTHPDAAGLVVAMDINHAKAIADRFRELTGERPPVVHSDDTGSSERIKAFERGTGRWIIAVKMISEGVDIPRLRVGIYATNILSELFFLQFIGRFVRMIAGLDDQIAYLLIPRLDVFVGMIQNVQAIRDHCLSEETEEATKDVDAGQTTEDKIASTFVPISSTGKADDVFHHDGVAVSQDDIQAANKYMTEAGAPLFYDPAIIARILKVATGSPFVLAAIQQPRGENLKPVYDQKKDLAKVIKKHVSQIVEMTDGKFDHKGVFTELIKKDGLNQAQCTVDQLKARVKFLADWVGRLRHD